MNFKMGVRAIYLFLFLMIGRLSAEACECPLSALNMVMCDKYEIIFKGKITAVQYQKDKLSEAVFDIEELYKGNATKTFKVLFDDKEDCAQKLAAGQEWIIYGRYKQIDNMQMDWCSRSRKHFAVPQEDFYTVTYGNDYDDESAFLKKQFGLHRFLTATQNQSGGRNNLPSLQQSILILISSVLVLLLFYFLFNKFFK